MSTHQVQPGRCLLVPFIIILATATQAHSQSGSRVVESGPAESVSYRRLLQPSPWLTRQN
jgi:hypothetical protein